MLHWTDHLTPADLRSETWGRLSKFLHARLEELREQNDAPHDAVKTSEIRGSIKEIKTILGLAEQANPSEAPVRSDADEYPGFAP